MRRTIHFVPATSYSLERTSKREKWLPKLATAEWIGAWGLTETGTGSDAGGMDTTAVLDGDHYVLNGSKNWITHAISSEIAVVIARTGEKGDSHGMTAFVVEKSTPGFTAGQKENKLGMRASETACLFFDDCRVPKENVLGKVGDGFIQAMKISRRRTHLDRRTYPSVLLAGAMDAAISLCGRKGAVREEDSFLPRREFQTRRHVNEGLCG